MDVREHESGALGALKAAPPVAATGMTVLGYPIADWLVIATLAYTIIQTAMVIHGLIKRRRRRPAICDGCPHSERSVP